MGQRKREIKIFRTIIIKILHTKTLQILEADGMICVLEGNSITCKKRRMKINELIDFKKLKINQVQLKEHRKRKE